MKPKLSVLSLTYNHERFIRQALDGFVMQKTNFPFEVIIHDDASTDGTTDIIREYEKKYPDIIKPIYQKENQFSKGLGVIERKFFFPRVEGKYVAMCEGDDYWTDENKLQKQVDFLDANPDVSICFHPVKLIWEDHSRPDSIFPPPEWRANREIFSFDDVRERYFMQTCSVVYRWRLKGHEDLFPEGIMPGDNFLHLLHAQVGKAACLPDIMAVYNKHPNGVWYGDKVTDDWFLRFALPNLAYDRALEERFDCDKRKEMINVAARAIFVFMKYEEWEKMHEIERLYPEIYQPALGMICDNIF